MRGFASAILDALDEGRVGYAGMIRFDLGEGTFGFIRRTADYAFGGVTYKRMPAGILSISDLSGTTGMAAEGVVVELSASPDDGLTPDVMLQIESYDYRDRPVTIYDLIVDPDTGAALADPVAVARGYINAIEHIDDPDRGFITRAECEGRAIDYSRTNGRVTSLADHQRRAPGDAFREHAGTAGRINQPLGRS